MRKKFFATALALMLVTVCFGSAKAQIGAITIDNVTGLYAPDTIAVGTPVEFIFRLTNTLGETVFGSANGFRVYSPDGATWSPGIFVDTNIISFPPPTRTVYDTTLYGQYIDPPTAFGGVLVWEGGDGTTTFSMYDGGLFINTFSEDGVGADTVGFAGFQQTSGFGIPDTFDDIGWKIRIESVDASSHGSTICIDSSYFPPAGVWKWALTGTNEHLPGWDGPYCYTIFDPSGPTENIPVITCASPVQDLVCATGDYCISLPITDLGSGTVTSTAGGTWANDQLCWNITSTTVVTDTVIATNTAGSDTCIISVDITLGTSATITSCPGPITQTICGAGLICAPISIANATSVTSSAGGTYSAGNNEICWPFNASAVVTDTIIAVGDCGSDTCIVTVDVTVSTPATIANCPGSPIVLDICGPQDVCAALSITNADSVTSTQGGTYDAGQSQICWSVASSIAVTDTIVAWSVCGNDTCIVDVTVNVTPSATITCPSTPPPAFDICGPQAVCLPLPIVNADSVTSTQGGTWFNDEICWDVPGASFSVMDTVVAWSNCANDTCIIPVTVNFISAPSITCAGPFAFNLCGAQTLCIDLPITDAVTVTSTAGGTWANDSLCWNIQGPLNIVDTVVATNSCGVDSCFISVQVTFTPKASITCKDSVVTSVCGPTQICDGLPVTDADSVTAAFGTWSNDVICWTINATTNIVDTVVAWSACGNDTCIFPVKVNLDKNLVVTPDTLFFSVVQGDANTHTQKFFVDDDAGCGIPYTTAEGSSLFFSNPTSGNTPDTITVSVSIGAVTVGMYLDSIEISSTDAINSPVYKYVHVTITDKPNAPPTITAIADTTFDECGSVSLPVSANDTDAGDQLTLWLVPNNVPNATLTDNGGGSGTFDFVPDFTQAGVYPFTVWVSDGIDSASTSFTVTITDCLPGVRNDIHVAGVSAVPGSRIEIPVNFTNLCDLNVLAVTLGWTTDSLYLDSVSFVGSRVEGYTALSAVVDNNARTVEFDLAIQAGEFSVAPDSGLLATLYFSSAAFIPAGTYDIDVVGTPSFDLDCGQGAFTEEPFFFAGFAIIDDAPAGGYTCGYVVDDQGNGIPGAMVELWQDYPCVGPDYMTTTNSFGAYAFEGFGFGTFDIYAYATDTMTYPAAAEDNNFGDVGIQLTLSSVTPLNLSDAFTFYYCDVSYYRQCLLPVGTMIEAKDNDDVICGRALVTEAGKYGFMPVYRDSAGSVDDEGAVTGEDLRFYVNGVQALATGNVTYPATNFDRIEVCLDAGAIVTQTCTLVDGWNLISWNLDTESDDIEEVLTSIMSCVEVVVGFEQGGLAYDPLLIDFSTLWNVDHLSGYWVKIKPGCQATLDITGLEVDESTPIVVTAGWNLVSYLPTDQRAPVDALCSIIDNPVSGNLQIAYGYDNGVEVFKPGAGGLNTLTAMGPCFGYWVKVQADAILDYSGCVGPIASSKVTQTARHALAAPDDVAVTTSWINVYSRNLSVNGQQVKAGAIVTAHNSAGEKIGYYRMTQSGKFGFMAVYADDANSNNVAGIRPGEDFYFAVDGNPTNENFEWTQIGDRKEIGSLTAKGTSGGNLPDAYNLSQNYPNPFNPTTNINFTLPASGKATVEVYNMLGKKIATPFDGIAEAGENVVVWDARDSEGRRVASGVYFYRLTSGSFSATRKMTLLK